MKTKLLMVVAGVITLAACAPIDGVVSKKSYTPMIPITQCLFINKNPCGATTVTFIPECWEIEVQGGDSACVDEKTWEQTKIGDHVRITQ